MISQNATIWSGNFHRLFNIQRCRRDEIDSSWLRLLQENCNVTLVHLDASQSSIFRNRLIKDVLDVGGTDHSPNSQLAMNANAFGQRSQKSVPETQTFSCIIMRHTQLIDLVQWKLITSSLHLINSISTCWFVVASNTFIADFDAITMMLLWISKSMITSMIPAPNSCHFKNRAMYVVLATATAGAAVERATHLQCSMV